ncbi:MAG: 4Fe-4S dicluster domain-containing protein [Deltaproteobacteria bacterium]|nr:4Fe-4S dicluster domain-containing protein [Deltaproteobacteria bacterium]
MEWTHRFRKWIEHRSKQKLSRRTFLKGLFAGGASLGVASSLPPSPYISDRYTWENFFQKHYKEMTSRDKEKVFARIERETKQNYKADVKISDPPALPGVKFVYCLNLSACNGSRYCVKACVEENNQSRNPQIQYIKVLELDRGSFNLEKSNRYYEGESVPREGKFYIPVQCMQCDNPPCVKACPVQATWKEPDGIVVIDYDWCIGCRYCQVACPYEARNFNLADPSLEPQEVNPNQSYLSNRIRPRGVMEKCTFCLHRVRQGRYPACLEACPTGARKFGNILDPESEVSKILKAKKAFVLKEELNTVPSFFYYFDD